MATLPFTFDADENLVRGFEQLPDESKTKALMMLRITLRSFVAPRWKTLTEAMDHVGRTAEANGLTEAELESILHEQP